MEGLPDCCGLVKPYRFGGSRAQGKTWPLCFEMLFLSIADSVFFSVPLSIPLEGSVSCSLLSIPLESKACCSLLPLPLLSPKLSLPFFLWASAFQVCYSSVSACRLPALILDALAARLAFLLKLSQLAAADPGRSHFSWQWRGNAFSLVLSTGSIADPLCLLPDVLLRLFKKQCLQGVWPIASCFGGELFVWGHGARLADLVGGFRDQSLWC